MKRRTAIKTLGLGTAVAMTTGLSAKPAPLKTIDQPHILSLCWDDGFKESTIKTAKIFEQHDLSGNFNVVASGHFKSFTVPDEYQVTPKGDFRLWNDLQKRGHEIHPHSYKHANLRDLPLEESQHLITICLDYFEQHLDGFDRKKTMFHFPYNASSPELEEWLLTQVHALRTGGGGRNDMPHQQQRKLTCTGYGPGSTENHLEAAIEKLLAQPSGWLVYNVHGLDGEGWGPMRSEFLDGLLGRLKNIESLAILPPGQALETVQK